MTQGGARRPANPASYSGVGKNSRRTDGQAIKSPNVQEGTDLTQGDRKIIEGGQRQQPIGRTPTPQMGRPGPSGEVPQGGTGELPQHLFEIPTTRSGEDVMTPASEAPIVPEDDMEIVLAFLAYHPDIRDQASLRMLQDHRATKQAPEMLTSAPAPAQVAPGPEADAETSPGEPEPVELGESASQVEPGPSETAAASEASVEELL